MAPFLTLWTSPSTVQAQARVVQIINAAQVADAVIDSVSIAGRSVEESVQILNNAFNRLVSMNMSDSTLHIVAVVPMYEEDTAKQIHRLYNVCCALEHNITLHILGLSPGIKRIFDAKTDTAIATSVPADYQDMLKSLCEKASFCLSYSLIDNYAENGAPIGFTLESLSHYIALIQIALMQDYYAIMSPALVNAHLGENLSIGIASLSFDRNSTVRRMLGLGFIEALDNVGINDSEVDAQKAAREAEAFLIGITKRYPNLFDRSIRPLYREQGMDEGRVAAVASRILNDEIASLKNEILSLLKSETLSLPEKEAILGMILGRDNERLRGVQYEHEGALLDDVCEEPINLYIEAYNRCCKDTKLLPIRGDFEALKRYDWDEKKKDFVESSENTEALNPLADIKRLKQEIINATSFIRDKQDELEKLQESVQQRKDVEEIKSKWHKPKGTLKDIAYNEQPLDQQYTPAPGLKVKDAVDLREFFSPVKNQESLGSCTSFAAVAMYEAMMSLAGVERPNDLSPAYLYYYSNVIKGRPAGGSNFYEQFEVLGTYGVCLDKLYVYDTDSPTRKPSAEANDDAKNHRVLEAKQISLFNESDKSVTLLRNHVLITSTLSEGHPVGISLKIYDNFGKDGAFILHPEDAHDAKEDGWHAMVIVGYSEENNFYIVRNSWGPDFGEDGYCYIPTAYIDDPEYMNFACIITRISDKAEGVKADVPTVLANFAATESEIRIAAIRNAVAKMRVDLKNSQKLYAEYYKYYQRLVLQLTMPNVQNSIRSAAEYSQTIRYINTDEKKRNLENTFVDKLKEYKKSLQKIILSLTAFCIVLGVASYLSESYLLLIFFIISAGLCGLTFIGYKWWKRRKRRHLQEELDLVAIDVRNQAQEMLEMQIRFHVAGMWLNRFHKLSLEIGDVYNRLVCYNSTLHIWHESYTRQIGSFEIPEGQMFRILDPTPLLLRFFTQNKAAIASEVDLIKLFENYQANPDSIESSHQDIQKVVTAVIDSLIGDFNITNLLLGDSYPYLNPVNLQEEIATLINVGQPSYRNPAMNATTPTRILIANVLSDRDHQWTSTINQFFPMPPVQLHYDKPDTIIILTIHPHNARPTISL